MKKKRPIDDENDSLAKKRKLGNEGDIDQLIDDDIDQLNESFSDLDFQETGSMPIDGIDQLGVGSNVGGQNNGGKKIWSTSEFI